MRDISNAAHRLVFLTVNSSFSHSSLALPLLHSACRELENWEWLRYDMTSSSDVISAVRDIYNLHCDLLVTDLYLFNRQTAMDVLQRIHTLQPECRIAVGGPECLGEGAEELLQQYPFLDKIFRGEGEEIFRDYLEKLESALPFDFFSRDAASRRANGHFDPERAEIIDSIHGIINDARELIRAHYNSDIRMQTVSVRLLERHADFCDLIADWMAAKTRGHIALAEELYNKARIECGKFEAEWEYLFDHSLFFSEYGYTQSQKSKSLDTITIE